MIPIPTVAFVGPSGAGKTSLMTELIRVLKGRGYRLGAVKHVHHGFVIDHEGKDSHRLKAAGARGVVITSEERLALVKEVDSEPELEEIVATYFDPREVDLVLAEGFSGSGVPKVLIRRRGGEADFRDVEGLVAVVGEGRSLLP